MSRRWPVATTQRSAEAEEAKRSVGSSRCSARRASASRARRWRAVGMRLWTPQPHSASATATNEKLVRRQAAVPGSRAMRAATQQTVRQRAASSGAKAGREGPRTTPRTKPRGSTAVALPLARRAACDAPEQPYLCVLSAFPVMPLRVSNCVHSDSASRAASAVLPKMFRSSM
eukprot:1488831-Alexandrium_andersonii.AAC.1